MKLHFKLFLFAFLATQVLAQPSELAITAVEYFFDADPGVGLATPLTITPDSQVIIFEDVSAASLSPGLHTLYMRMNDSRGVWSAAKGVLLRVKPESPTGTEFIAEAEAYFDTDPGVGNGIVMYAEDGSYDELEEAAYRNVRADTLTLGQHIAYVHVRSATGTWSFIAADTVNIGGPETFRLAAYQADTVGDSVRLTWQGFPGVTEYRVYYDSVATGPFTSFNSVFAPDTSLILPTTVGAGRRFYYLTAYWPETIKKSKEQGPEW